MKRCTSTNTACAARNHYENEERSSGFRVNSSPADRLRYGWGHLETVWIQPPTYTLQTSNYSSPTSSL